jgi:hypothetical protein
MCDWSFMGRYFNKSAELEILETLLKRSLSEYERGLYDGIAGTLMEHYNAYYAIDASTECMELFFKSTGIDKQKLYEEFISTTCG